MGLTALYGSDRDSKKVIAVNLSCSDCRRSAGGAGVRSLPCVGPYAFLFKNAATLPDSFPILAPPRNRTMTTIKEDVLNIALFRSGFRWDAHLERIAIITWSAVFLVVSVRMFIEPDNKTVYPIFSASARLWWSGIDTYEPGRPADVQNGYRYGPTFAIAVTPFAIFPDAVGGVVWRLFNLAALLGALGWFARAVLPAKLTTRLYAGLLLLVLPLALTSINNGQANLVVIACMIGAVAAVAQERWNLATALLTAAFVMKLYPLALGMMLMLLYPRRLAWRIPLAALASFLLPSFSSIRLTSSISTRNGSTCCSSTIAGRWTTCIATFGC